MLSGCARAGGHLHLGEAATNWLLRMYAAGQLAGGMPARLCQASRRYLFVLTGPIGEALPDEPLPREQIVPAATDLVKRCWRCW